MRNERKSFRIGQAFENNTVYIGDRANYHIYPQDTEPIDNCWYTLVSPQDPPLMAAFVLRDLEDVTIDLNGARLIFHGRIMPFALYHCRNIVLRNFTIDYERPFFSQGTVTDTDDNSITLDIPDIFPYRIDKGEFVAIGENWERSLNYGAPLFQTYDAQTMRLSSQTPMMLAVIGDKVTPQQNPPCPIFQLRAEQLSGRQVRLKGIADFFHPNKGEIVAFTHENRHKTGFQMENCSDITLENIRLLHISALGVIANLCHNLTFHNFSCFVDEQMNGRIITVIADFIHGFHCSGRVLVEDCRMENMLDDALNLHGNYTISESMIDKHTMISNNRSYAMHNMPIYLPGDLLNVYRGFTQELKAVYTVESASYIPGDSQRQILVFREPIIDFVEGDLLENRRMPEIIVRNCTSMHARGSWRVSTGKHFLMEDCRIENMPIVFTGDTNYWFENGPVRDVEIRNNVFEHFSYCAPIGASPIFEKTDKVPYYHGGIRIINNQFVDCKKGILFMQDVKGIVFRGNQYMEEGEACGREMHFENCTDITIEE